MSQPASFETLPNEILSLILISFPIKDLLSIASTSRRCHSTIDRLLNQRLLHVTSLPDYNLILECYHPSAKISTPYYSCRYLGTKDVNENENPPNSAILSFSALSRQQYVSFRPVLAEENQPRRFLHSTGEVDDTITEEIYLDENELFSQLCTIVNVMKPGPKPGFFLSHVNIFDGVLRIWREWLGEMNIAGPEGSQTLWVDADRTVGLRFSVSLGPMERMPVLTGPDDHPPISYKLVYEELLIRSRELLLGAERSALQEISHTGKAVVIASVLST